MKADEPLFLDELKEPGVRADKRGVLRRGKRSDFPRRRRKGEIHHKRGGGRARRKVVGEHPFPIQEGIGPAQKPELYQLSPGEHGRASVVK